MKRKEYRKPTMLVVKLQHEAHLLAGSGNPPMKNSIDGWGNGGSLNNDGDDEELTI